MIGGGVGGHGAINRGSGTPTPADPKAAMLALFARIKGTHTISGQFIEQGPLNPITAIHTSTGKWLGLIGGDYYYFNAPLSQNPNFAVNSIFIDYFNAGGIITLYLGFPNPSTGGGEADTGGRLADVINTSSTVYTTHINTLSKVAVGLKQLDAAGIPVMLRIYPEMYGNWFWWGTQAGTNAEFIQLFRMTHDYFVNTAGIKNFLYIFASNAGSDPTPRYPGDAYVDVTGFDLYTDSPASFASTTTALLAMAPTKPTALIEFGAGGPSLGNTLFNEQTLVDAFKNNMKNVVFWQQWWDGNGGNTGWGMAEVQNATGALADPWVLNRGDFVL